MSKCKVSFIATTKHWTFHTTFILSDNNYYYFVQNATKYNFWHVCTSTCTLSSHAPQNIILNSTIYYLEAKKELKHQLLHTAIIMTRDTVLLNSFVRDRHFFLASSVVSNYLLRHWYYMCKPSVWPLKTSLLIIAKWAGNIILDLMEGDEFRIKLNFYPLY